MRLIEFENVSKRFVLHHERARSFQELFVNAVKRNSGREEFWAIKDVSFQIEQGESLAIVGPNGSGKSTTLKLVSRILQPTKGQVTVAKRVSALLELGAGFHPELTGRENVYLNGSLFGYSRSEMDAKFDDIVEFAELEHFIDTPIKHFSTGMVMRLGFSVAIFTDPEILITDEVLAVGDESFQRKCLDKIWQYRHEGRTIIFVSHSLSTVRTLCQRAIWLDHGVMKADGAASDVVDAYLVDTYKRSAEHGIDAAHSATGNRWGTGQALITDVRFCEASGAERTGPVYETGEPMVVRVSYDAKERIERPQFGLAIHRADGMHITGPNNVVHGRELPAIEGAGWFEYRIDRLPLLQGKYELTIAIYDHEALHPFDHHHRMYVFNVLNGTVREQEGGIQIPASWRFSQEVGDLDGVA